ncbi:MATE family efflux transporter [Cuneatibacter sp. NSJ-177]|uniref:MATE family efflux transporter n=1 Tax=Cuneatibacter sp. NSJ-177 TaxID=2931401 RepID=UPI001FD3011C|nr:MATE family efflux transporter [Cuneatibacter sp. NSJ-177]MCJ7835500.1 MATE family efflux transporter [Cuneatibacter sp. NSJ-177]
MKKEHTANYELTEGVIWKQLLLFFFPIMLGSFFQQLYNTADTVIVGQFVGKEALAAVGATGQPIQLLVGFFVGISSGSTVIISQFFGAKRTQDIEKAIHTSVALSLAGGLLFMLIGLALSDPILRVMNTPADCFESALLYIRIYFLGMIPTFLYNMGTGILRALGDSKSPMYILIACCIVNILLDLLLVPVMKLGIFGAALATILSQLLSAVLVAISLIRKKSMFTFRFRKLNFTPNMLGRILLIGFPTGLQSATYSISNVVVQSGVNSFGTDMVAAWSAFSKMDSIFWMISGAFGIAVTTFVGQNFGAKNFDRIRKSVRISLSMEFAAAAFSSLLFLAAGPYLLKIFTNDADVLACGMQLIHLLTPFYALFACIEIFSGAIRGVGEALYPMLVSIFGVCLFRVVWMLFILPLHHTIGMIAICYPVSWGITSVIFLIYYLRGNWLKRGLSNA